MNKLTASRVVSAVIVLLIAAASVLSAGLLVAHLGSWASLSFWAVLVGIGVLSFTGVACVVMVMILLFG